MYDFSSRIDNITFNFDDKKKTKYQLDVFKRLCNKMKGIDENLNRNIEETIQLLSALKNDETSKPKEYLKSLNMLKETEAEEAGKTY